MVGTPAIKSNGVPLINASGVPALCKDGGCCGKCCKAVISLRLLNGVCNFDMSGFDSTACPGETIISYEWDFGDNNTGSGGRVQHDYSGLGPYTITLTITDSSGCIDVATAIADCGCATNGPVADFTATQLSANPCTFQFTDTSIPGTAPIVEWLWTFEGGGVSIEQNPIHAFPTPSDDYGVTLQVTDANDCVSQIIKWVSCTSRCCTVCFPFSPQHASYTIPVLAGGTNCDSIQTAEADFDLSCAKSTTTIPNGLASYVWYYTSSETCYLEVHLIYVHGDGTKSIIKWRKAILINESCLGQHSLPHWTSDTFVLCDATGTTVDIFIT